MTDTRPIQVRLGVREAETILKCLYGPGVVNDHALNVFKQVKKKLGDHRHRLRSKRHATNT